MDTIYFFDISLLALAIILTAFFLIKRRKKLEREGILYLYKTKVGLKFIEYISKRYSRTIKILSYVSIGLGYILMICGLYLFFKIIYMLSNPEIARIIKIPPVMPLIPYLPEIFNISWLPPLYFSYWIIAIALVALFHEGFHGIFARAHKIKIKSTGFGFLGPLLAFFVEQDDKDMEKSKTFSQLAVLSAGVFANFLLFLLFGVLFILFTSFCYVPSGLIFTDYSFDIAELNNITIKQDSVVEYANITKVYYNNKPYLADLNLLEYAKKGNYSLIKIYQDQPFLRMNISVIIYSVDNVKIEKREDIRRALSDNIPGQIVNVTIMVILDKNEYNFKYYSIKLGEDYQISGKPVLGIVTFSGTDSFRSTFSKLIPRFADPNIFYKPIFNDAATEFIYYLLWWIMLINISMAAANMLPVGIFDGGRFYMLSFFALTKNMGLSQRIFKITTYIILALLGVGTLFWFFSIIGLR